MLGQIKIFKNGSDVTRTCRVAFEDTSGRRSARVSLDKGAWIQERVTPGLACLARVSCAIGKGLHYSPRNLCFEVQGPTKATYFGHVRLELGSRLNDAVEMVRSLNPVAGIIMQASLRDKLRNLNRVTVADHSSAMLAHFRRTHRRDLPVPLVASLPGSASTESDIVRHGNLLSAESNLSGLKLIWLGVLDGDEPRLAFRFRQEAAQPELAGCAQLDVLVDGDIFSYPVAHKADTRPQRTVEVAQAEIQMSTLERMLRSRSVYFQACGLTRQFGVKAARVGAHFLSEYRSLRAQRSVLRASEGQAGPAAMHEEPMSNVESSEGQAAGPAAMHEEPMSNVESSEGQAAGSPAVHEEPASDVAGPMTSTTR